VVLGGIRLYFLWEIFNTRGPERMYQIGYTTSAIETNVAIVAACGPSLWPLARRRFPNFFANMGFDQGLQGNLPRANDTEALPESRRAARPCGSWFRFKSFRRQDGSDRKASQKQRNITPEDGAVRQGESQESIMARSFVLLTERVCLLRTGLGAMWQSDQMMLIPCRMDQLANGYVQDENANEK